MIGELLIRFLVGGLVVSAFAGLGDILKPKTFAGLFGAAPSVALATLGLTFMTHGGSYAGIEGRSMVAGALALALYSVGVRWLLVHRKSNAMVAAGSMWLEWLGVAFALWVVFLR